jgi:hypothetical protein
LLRKSTASNPRPLRRQVVRGVVSCRPASSEVVIRNSLDGIARRSRGAVKSPGRGPGSSIGKIDNFLPSRLGPGIVFQKGRQARLGLLVGATCDWGFGLRAGNGSGMDVTSTLVKQAAAGPPIAALDVVRPDRLSRRVEDLARKAAIDRVTKKDTQASETIGARPFVRGRVRSGEFRIIGSKTWLAPPCRPASRGSQDREPCWGRRRRQWRRRRRR